MEQGCLGIGKVMRFVCDVSSSPLLSPGRLRIVFNVIEQVAGNGRHCHRRGVCTGWLSDLTLPVLSPSSDSVDNALEKLSLTHKPVLVCPRFDICIVS